MKRCVLTILTAFMAALMLIVPVNVFAEDDSEYYDDLFALADDDALFLITYCRKPGMDGRGVYIGYKIDEAAIPADENDFPAQNGKGPYFSSEYEAVNAVLEENEVLVIAPRFRVDFPERDSGVISMEGVKFYIIDPYASRGSDIVRYAGAEVIFEEIVDPDEPVTEMPDYELPRDEEVYVRAEDGTDGYLYIYSDGSAPGYVISHMQPENEYDFPEYLDGMGLNGNFYSNPDDIPLNEDEQLAVTNYVIVKEDGSRISCQKYYVVNSTERTLTYAGHSMSAEQNNTEGGFTTAPATGNGSGYMAVGAVSLAAAMISRKKCKKG